LTTIVLFLSILIVGGLLVAIIKEGLRWFGEFKKYKLLQEDKRRERSMRIKREEEKARRRRQNIFDELNRRAREQETVPMNRDSTGKKENG